MIKKFILLILNTLLSNVAFTQRCLEDSITTKITEIIRSIKNDNYLPGISFAIVHDNNIIYKNALGYTDLEKLTLASTRSRYPIMSISKIFTA